METRPFEQKTERARFKDLTATVARKMEERGVNPVGKVVDAACGLGLCADGIIEYMEERGAEQEVLYEGYDVNYSTVSGYRTRWGLSSELPEKARFFLLKEGNVLCPKFKESVSDSIDDIAFFLIRQPDVRDSTDTFEEIFKTVYSIAEKNCKPIVITTSNALSLLMIHRLLRLVAIDHVSEKGQNYRIDYGQPDPGLVADLNDAVENSWLYLEETGENRLWDKSSDNPYSTLLEGLDYRVTQYDPENCDCTSVVVETIDTFENSVLALESMIHQGRMVPAIHKDRYTVILTFHNEV